MEEEVKETTQPEKQTTAEPEKQMFRFTGEPPKSPFFSGQNIGTVLADAKKVASTADAGRVIANPTNPTPAPAPAAPQDKEKAPEVTQPEKTTAPVEKPSEKEPEKAAPSESEKPQQEEPEEKLGKMRGVDLSRLQGYEVTGKPDDADSIQRIVDKYKGNPEALANALLHHQRFENDRYRDSELKRLRDEVREMKAQANRLSETSRAKRYDDNERGEYDEAEEKDDAPRQPERAEKRRPGRPKESERSLTERAEKIAEQIQNEELDVKTGLVELARILDEASTEKAQSQIQKAMEALQNQQLEGLQERVDTHNARVYVSRAKAILSEAARREGQTALAQRYAEKNYQLSEDEYNAAKSRLTEEFEYIQRHFKIPDSGEVSLELFERASRLLEPQDYENQIRLDERRKVLAQIQQGKPNGSRLPVDSGINTARSPVETAPKPPDPANTKGYSDYQQWFLSLPKAERDRVLREAGLSRQ
jgi:hypothetical protein